MMQAVVCRGAKETSTLPIMGYDDWERELDRREAEAHRAKFFAPTLFMAGNPCKSPRNREITDLGETLRRMSNQSPPFFVMLLW